MVASMAQRLVRRLCPHCAEVYTPDTAELAQLQVDSASVPNAAFKRARGCDRCRNTGYRGRRAIYEILPFSNAIKEMTIARESSIAIKRKAREEGMRTLREAGWLRVCEGDTSIDEVMRVTAESDFLDGSETSHAPV
jgi:type II secretory ATPase GspE/PulE/Tfp pilus assembly ATPase PilB-like protein